MFGPDENQAFTFNEDIDRASPIEVLVVDPEAGE
jgi:hypothetical protein